MSLTWTLAEIRTELREVAKLKDTSEWPDAGLDDRINDFLQNHFPGFVNVEELKTFFTIDTTATDDGEYALASNMHSIEKPMTVKDSDSVISTPHFYKDDKEKFFREYPEDANDETDERNTPAGVLVYGRVVFLRPKPDAIYTFKTAAKKKPAALTSDSSTLLDVRWGPAIVQGTAMFIVQRTDLDAAIEISKVFQAMIAPINSRDIIQRSRARKRSKPSW